MTFRHLQAAILDWAGTAVDFGSLAPVAALQRVFEANGVPVTAAEVREHMGTLKKDQIRSICAVPRVAGAWTALYGHAPAESDVERLFAEFLPQQSEILVEFSAPIPGVPETVAAWRAAGLRIGSTTGYTRPLLDIVLSAAAARGYTPDASVTPDEVGGGRPKPFMCYRNAILLGVYPLWHCVKIGDTPSDIGEGRNAGMWTIGITATGNQVGLSLAEWDALPAAEQSRREREAAGRLAGAGAHFVAPSVAACGGILQEIDRRLAAGGKP
ncbi:MAG TPA: phosphonoacetaldehyde hydrolase [Verrucomicrobiae bacterium]|nr:phosphonoacetaldehyde hydrolase [Verrucomicrobiae bacterium]